MKPLAGRPPPSAPAHLTLFIFLGVKQSLRTLSRQVGLAAAGLQDKRPRFDPMAAPQPYPFPPERAHGGAPMGGGCPRDLAASAWVCHSTCARAPWLRPWCPRPVRSVSWARAHPCGCLGLGALRRGRQPPALLLPGPCTSGGSCGPDLGTTTCRFSAFRGLLQVTGSPGLAGGPLPRCLGVGGPYP